MAFLDTKIPWQRVGVLAEIGVTVAYVSPPAERVGTGDGRIKCLILPLHIAPDDLSMFTSNLYLPCHTVFKHDTFQQSPRFGRERTAELRSGALHIGSLTHDWMSAEEPDPFDVHIRASTASPLVQEVCMVYPGTAEPEARVSIYGRHACVEQDAYTTLIQQIVKLLTWSLC